MESSENPKPYENPSLLKTIPPPLAEDRSIKKAKFRSHGADADNPTPLSFKDALVHPDQYRNSDDTEMEEEWEFEPGDVTVGDDGTMPVIKFSKRIQDKLIKPWQNSVVVKLLGRNIGYKVLCNRLKVMWHQIHDFSVIDLENNYFLIRLKSPEDDVYALTEGPWVIFGHYLTVQPWTPQFDSTVTDLDSAIVWIRLPGMAFHFYDKRILRKIGQIVGTVIKIDYLTELRERGKFARIAVRISLSQPLLSQFNLDGKIQKVEYEGLPVICYQCGKYGHNSIVCHSKQKMNEANNDTSANIVSANTAGGKDGVVAISTNKSEKFGPWMIVARKGKPKFIVEKENFTAAERSQRATIPVTSRFDALSEDSENNNTVEAAVTTPNLEPPQRQTKSITDHFHNRKNLPLKTPSILKPQNQLSKGKQVARSHHPVLKQQNLTASTSMHANLRPSNTRILLPTANVPIPNPSRISTSFPRDPTSTFTLTTLDPQKHIAITFSTKNHETVGTPPGFPRNQTSVNSEQHPHPPQINEPPEDKEKGDINSMEDYVGASQLASGNKADDNMSDEENSFVNETPGMHDETELELCA
ncbi:reverse transcriptase domain-containing protein [Citrus sinensis]|nr:reverse transcriptase domain-containing protein [Citrus sinensis]